MFRCLNIFHTIAYGGPTVESNGRLRGSTVGFYISLRGPYGKLLRYPRTGATVKIDSSVRGVAEDQR